MKNTFKSCAVMRFVCEMITNAKEYKFKEESKARQYRPTKMRACRYQEASKRTKTTTISLMKPAEVHIPFGSTMHMDLFCFDIVPMQVGLDKYRT